MVTEFVVRWMLPVGCALLLAPMAANAQGVESRREERPRLISVNGQAEVRRAPDQVALSVGVEERGQDVQVLREQAARKAQDALQALLRAGVKRENIQTSRFSIRREWEPEPGPRNALEGRIEGRWVFVVNNTVSVRTPMVDKAGDLLDAVVKAGFNNINGPFFSLQDDAAARRDALEAAVRDAQAKAEVIARTTGVRLGPVESVTETGGFMPGPRPEMFAARAVAADMSTPTPIESGEIVISESVNAAFRIIGG